MSGNPNDGTGLENEEGHAENLVATFQTLSSEGDLLLQRGSFHEAIDVYSKALSLRAQDKHCLVCRSKCYIQIGSPILGLADADASLKDDPNYFKGMFQKAEALYAQGDFELALVYYHRGHQLRPELNEFRTGIQKAREAIDNSIGSRAYKIKVPQKLRRNLALLAASQPMDSKSAAAATAAAVKQAQEALKNTKTGAGQPGTQTSVPEQPKPYYLAGHLTSAMENKLLGELFEDKVYLQELLTDKDFIDYPEDHVLCLVNEGLRYLNTRVEFWRQQNPLYARPKEQKIKPRMDKHNLHHVHGAAPSSIPNTQ